MLDGYAVLAGGANADTTGASAHNATCAFAGASVPGAVARLWDAAGPADATEARERDRRALAWWSDPALYGPGGWTARDAEIARESLRRRLARPVRKNPGMFPLAGEDFAIGANPGTG